jgi:phage-related protein (TIGR01555 family)
MNQPTKRAVGRPRKNHLPELKTLVPHTDDWQNSITGLGGKSDRTTYTQYGKATILDDGTLTEMFWGDGLANRIITVIADDMTREWIYLPEESQSKIITPILESLSAEQKYSEALTWQRLYGGCLLVMGILDGRNIDQPLNENNVRAIEYLRPIDRTCVIIPESTFDKDVNSPTFGKVLQFKVRYMLNNEQYDMMIHHTRVIEFHNDPVPVSRYSGLTEDTRYWGMSSLQTVYESLANLGAIIQSTSSIMQNFCNSVLKFKGLAQLLAADVDGTAEVGLRKRLNAILSTQSMFNATVIDSEESAERQYTTLAGLPDVMDRFMLILSGTTSIPVTRLFGKSPSGLGSTGESDTRAYYDLVESNQVNRLLPPLRRLINLIARMKSIKEDVEIEFNSLYQLSEEEKSKIAFMDAQAAKLQAETDIIYMEAGVRDGEQVSIDRGFSGEWEEPEPEVVMTKPPVGAPAKDPSDDNSSTE